MKIIRLFNQITRPYKQALRISLLLCFAAFLAACTREIPSRPNILFAIADDWGWPHAGVYGDPVVRTPAFDRVANEGILFNYAFVTSPSCTPSRNSILTGQYHWRLGPGASLWSTLDPSTPVYPLIMQKEGFYVGHYRKSWGPGKLDGWEEHPAGKDYEGGFGEFMSQRPENTPFCFWLGSSDPHRGYDEGSGQRSGMNLPAIRLFECFPHDSVVRSDVADYYFEVQRFDSDLAAAIRLLEESGELENTLIVVTGDNGMPFPRCKANLYDGGTRVPLAIRWGSGIRRPGRTSDDFISLVDLAPTFLELAGIEIPEVMTGHSLVPLLKQKKEGIPGKGDRSFVITGKERHVPGQEGTMSGYPCRAIRTHDYLYIRNFKPDLWPAGTPNYLEAEIPYCWLGDCDNGPTKTDMTENRDLDEHHRYLWNLAFGKRPAEELYDCRRDPGQMVNLADDPEYADVKKDLAGQLTEQLRLTGDPRVTGQESLLEGFPYYGHGPRHPTWKPETQN
jgi:N-sulfoglucosamine sulfohydrolase